jgi:hypothetical protein
MPSWNFGAFSKICLNTSKPPKEKNVQNVEAHNFAVDWHWKFEGNLGEKCLRRCPTPVHWRRVFGHLVLPFLPKPVRKTPYTLWHFLKMVTCWTTSIFKVWVTFILKSGENSNGKKG